MSCRRLMPFKAVCKISLPTRKLYDTYLSQHKVRSLVYVNIETKV